MEVQKDSLKNAYYLAEKWHSGQTRDGTNEPYYNHVFQVSKYIYSNFGIQDEKSLCVAILHDILEDTKIPHSLFKTFFSEYVYNSVILLSRKIYKDGKLIHRVSKEKYYNDILKTDNVLVKYIKVADRINNLQGLEGWSDDRIIKKIQETIQYVVPIAKQLDIINGNKTITFYGTYVSPLFRLQNEINRRKKLLKL